MGPEPKFDAVVLELMLCSQHKLSLSAFGHNIPRFTQEVVC